MEVHIGGRRLTTDGAWERLQTRMAALLRGENPMAPPPTPISIRNVVPRAPQRAVTMDQLLRNFEEIKKNAEEI